MYKPVVDFIHGLYHSDDFIPLHAPCFIGNEKKYLNECIDTTFVSSVGKFVDRFEEMVAEYTGLMSLISFLSGKICSNGILSRHWFGMSQSFF